MKNLSNKLERCYNSKVTFEHMLKNQRSYGDKGGVGFIKKMTKGKRERARKIKKQEKEKLSHYMCFNSMKWVILLMVALMKRSSSEERRREAKACQMLQVLHMGSSHLYVPNQASGEATSRASIKATN